MAHKIEWMEEPWTIRVDYWDRMSVDDIEAVMKFCIDAVDKHPANFLCDFTRVNFQESELFKSKAMVKLFRHPNARWFALLGLNPVMHVATRTLMMRTLFKSFKNEQEAIAFLQEKTEKQKLEAATPPVTVIEKRAAS